MIMKVPIIVILKKFVYGSKCPSILPDCQFCCCSQSTLECGYISLRFASLPGKVKRDGCEAMIITYLVGGGFA